MNRVCNHVKEEHLCVSEFDLAVQEQKIHEKLQCDVEMLCVWQWCLLWFAVPNKNEMRRPEVLESRGTG